MYGLNFDLFEAGETFPSACDRRRIHDSNSSLTLNCRLQGAREASQEASARAGVAPAGGWGMGVENRQKGAAPVGAARGGPEARRRREEGERGR